MTEGMDSRLRGNDKLETGMTGGEEYTPTLILPPQGGGNIRNNKRNDRKTEKK